MNMLIILYAALAFLSVPQSPADCEMPPWVMDRSMRNPSVLVTDYNASAVVGATDVVNAGNALGWEDGNPAVLTQTSVLTVSWNFPFKSGIALWAYTPDSACPYVKITLAHYALLTAPPITTSEVWLSTSQAQYTGRGEDFIYDWILPLHRYVVIKANQPLWVDAIFHPMYTYLEIRWMPIVFAQ
jgi:hypothetical protein